MSTKFSVRPAPRKRPWICKRSPPCLIPPVFPPSLIATFALTRLEPPPHGDPYSGSLLLKWVAPLNHYSGVWTDGPNFYYGWFFHDPVTGISHATAYWDLGAYIENANYPVLELPLHPHLCYDTQQIETTTHPWRSRITITG